MNISQKHRRERKAEVRADYWTIEFSLRPLNCRIEGNLIVPLLLLPLVTHKDGFCTRLLRLSIASIHSHSMSSMVAAKK